MKRTLHTVSIAALLALVVAPVGAGAQNLPPAEEIRDRYVEAIGGRDAALAHESTHATGTFSMPAAGIEGKMETFQAEPDRMLVRVELPGLGTMRTGYDGEVGWSIDPMSGARVLEGSELAAIADQANQLAEVRDDSLIESMEAIGRTEIDGEACHQVKIVWDSDRETVDCYSVDTGLLIATTATQESHMGSVEITTRLLDYEEFGGIRMPTRITQDVMGQRIVMTIDSVEFDTVADDTFALPPEIETRVEDE